MSLLQDLQWRYATKNMNQQPVAEETVQAILEAANLSATSYGLQPFTLVVVSNQETKNALMGAAYGQPQVGHSSHVIVFTVPLTITQEHIDAFITNVATTRGLPLEALDGYKGMIVGSILSLTPEQQQGWSAKQAYIALGTALAAAAELKVDACPMEGFNAAQIDEILGLEAKGLKSVVMMPIGYRSEEDLTAHYKKVRKPLEELVHFVS